MRKIILILCLLICLPVYSWDGIDLRTGKPIDIFKTSGGFIEWLYLEDGELHLDLIDFIDDEQIFFIDVKTKEPRIFDMS